MWMSYVEYPEIVDLKSGVVNLSMQFSNLAWDAHHEAVYGMNRFYSYEDCEKIAESYDKAENLCDKYLQGKITIDKLVSELKNMKYDSFLMEITKVLPKHLQIFVRFHQMMIVIMMMVRIKLIYKTHTFVIMKILLFLINH